MGGSASYGGESDNNVIHFRKRKSRHSRKNACCKADKLPYLACEIDNTLASKGREEFFRIQYHDERSIGSIEMYRYADILQVYAPFSQTLLITTSITAFEIDGDYLYHIPTLIQDRRLRALTLFHPRIHQRPKADEPRIHKIRRINMVQEKLADQGPVTLKLPEVQKP